jgi:hypothetical protein
VDDPVNVFQVAFSITRRWGNSDAISSCVEIDPFSCKDEDVEVLSFRVLRPIKAF